MFPRRRVAPGRGLGDLLTQERELVTTGNVAARALSRSGSGAAGGLVIPARVRVLTRVYKTVAGSFGVITARSDRAFLALQNQSTLQNLYYQFAADAGLNAGWQLPPGAIDLYDITVPIDGVYVWCAVAGEFFALAEGVPA